MYSGPLRFVRALTVSATCVALTLAAHFLGSGSAAPAVSVVGVAGLLMTTVLLTLVLAALSGRRWTLGRSLVALALGQMGLNAIFTVLLSSPEHHGHGAIAMAGGAMMAGGASMTLAHGVAALLIGLGIAVNDSALDSYFALATSLVGSGISVLRPWHLAVLVAGTNAVTAAQAGRRAARFARSLRPRILTDLVVLQCLSRRGPPELMLAA